MINLVYLFKSGMNQMASDITRVKPDLGAEAQFMIAPLAVSSDPMELRAACETLATWIKLLDTKIVCQK